MVFSHSGFRRISNHCNGQLSSLVLGLPFDLTPRPDVPSCDPHSGAMGRPTRKSRGFCGSRFAGRDGRLCALANGGSRPSSGFEPGGRVFSQTVAFCVDCLGSFGRGFFAGRPPSNCKLENDLRQFLDWGASRSRLHALVGPLPDRDPFFLTARPLLLEPPSPFRRPGSVGVCFPTAQDGLSAAGHGSTSDLHQ